jgi:hypothetical protein
MRMFRISSVEVSVPKSTVVIVVTIVMQSDTVELKEWVGNFTTRSGKIAVVRAWLVIFIER